MTTLDGGISRYNSYSVLETVIRSGLNEPGAIAVAYLDPVNEAPVLQQNNVLMVNEATGPGITRAHLEVIDSDTADADLVFTVSTAPGSGQLQNSAGTVIASFTMADIDAGEVYYSHFGVAGTQDEFYFTVTDGFNSLPIETFSITIIEDDDRPTAVDNSYGIDEGGSRNLAVLANDSDADGDANPPDDSVSSEPQVDGTVISWSDDGWYQVQSQETFQTLCEGGTSCDVAVAGSYIVINLTTGQRWQDIVVGGAEEVDSGGDDADQMASGDDGQNNEDPDTTPTSPTEPDGDSEQLELQVDGLLISWADDGWYQVQSATTFETVCEGGSSCLVPARGLYNVINHSTGMRWMELAVFDTTGVWFGQSSFGDAVFVIDADGDLFGLSSNGIDTHESVFGNLGSDLPALRFLHRGSQNPLHGNAFLFSGERPTFTNPNELDSVVFDFSVTNEGQQLDNASVAGNFSLSYANTDDVAAISVADISGSWASRSSFCSSGCDLTLVMSFTGDGFVQGATFFNGANELGLAGFVSAATESTQYLNISFIWNGVRRTGVLYYDRNSNALVLNTIGDDSEIGQRSFSTLLVKQ